MAIDIQLNRIKAWMEVHAPILLSGLNPPASADEISKLENKLAFNVPSELTAFWNRHAGSGENCFFGHLNAVGPNHCETGDVLMFVVADRKNGSSVTDKISDNAWVPIAQQGYAEGIAIHAPSGQVFSWGKDSPAILPVANSLVAYLTQYADDLEAGLYTLEEGFSDHGFYLQRSLEAPTQAGGFSDVADGDVGGPQGSGVADGDVGGPQGSGVADGDVGGPRVSSVATGAFRDWGSKAVQEVLTKFGSAFPLVFHADFEESDTLSCTMAVQLPEQMISTFRHPLIGQVAKAIHGALNEQSAAPVGLNVVFDSLYQTDNDPFSTLGEILQKSGNAELISFWEEAAEHFRS